MRAFAEWEEQEALLVSLPHAGTDWAPYLGEIRAAYRDFIAVAVRFEPVVAIAPSREDFEQICGGLANASFAQIDTDDTWIRDYGAIDVEEGGKITGLNFRFNAWGGKFASAKDDALNSKLYAASARPLRDVDLILEGGSVDFDGAGTMLTTSACLLNENRNSLSKAELDARLREIFDLRNIIWLGRGFIKGDDTDSHVDTLARFLNPRVVAISSCDDPSDLHYAELGAMKDEISSLEYDVIELPIPRAIFYQGRRLPATYANFVFLNGALIVPTYADPADPRDPNRAADELALSRLRAACADREVVGVNARVFIRQNGSLHCSCMNKFKL